MEKYTKFYEKLHKILFMENKFHNTFSRVFSRALSQYPIVAQNATMRRDKMGTVAKSISEAIKNKLNIGHCP